ncbi:MAG: helix-turn-helix domain-containing protein [Nitrospirota bacterium]|nr:helix-turn-helix domain-containing protein [Nitrospirota bacterium]
MEQGIPTDPLRTWEWVKYQLGLRGLTIRALARANGITHPALTRARRYRTPKAQRLLAQAIGVTPETIWPERYVNRGKRNSRGKAKTNQGGL